MEHPRLTGVRFFVGLAVVRKKYVVAPSLGSMSQRGATAYAVLISIALTCHLRRISFRNFLAASLRCGTKSVTLTIRDAAATFESERSAVRGHDVCHLMAKDFASLNVVPCNLETEPIPHSRRAYA